MCHFIDKKTVSEKKESYAKIKELLLLKRKTPIQTSHPKFRALELVSSIVYYSITTGFYSVCCWNLLVIIGVILLGKNPAAFYKKNKFSPNQFSILFLGWVFASRKVEIVSNIILISFKLVVEAFYIVKCYD